MSLPAPKTSHLWMRIQNKDWWDVVLLQFTVAEWKESFIMIGHAFIQHFIQKEEPLVPHVIRRYAISASLHMGSPFSFSSFKRSRERFLKFARKKYKLFWTAILNLNSSLQVSLSLQFLTTLYGVWQQRAKVWQKLEFLELNSRRNSASSASRLKPKHSIKFLHLVKATQVFTLVLPSCLSPRILTCTSIIKSEFLPLASPAKHPLAQPAKVATPQTLAIGWAGMIDGSERTAISKQ